MLTFLDRFILSVFDVLSSFSQFSVLYGIKSKQIKVVLSVLKIDHDRYKKMKLYTNSKLSIFNKCKIGAKNKKYLHLFYFINWFCSFKKLKHEKCLNISNKQK